MKVNKLMKPFLNDFLDLLNSEYLSIWLFSETVDGLCVWNTFSLLLEKGELTFIQGLFGVAFWKVQLY